MEATSEITDVEIIAAARKCGPTAFLLISWLPANQGWCEYREYSCSVNITGKERASNLHKPTRRHEQARGLV